MMQTSLEGFGAVASARKKKNAVSVSWGKDSLLMFIRLIELKIITPEDTDVITADTRKEYKEWYEFVEEVCAWIRKTYPEWKDFQPIFVYAKKSWDEWFWGRSTSGKTEGKLRGAPLIAYPCYWAREAKVKAIGRIGKYYQNMFIGYALDEPKRYKNANKVDGFTRDGPLVYPLVDWGYTEDDCMKGLIERKVPKNVLYSFFDRLGCHDCIKMDLYAHYNNWKFFPEAWEATLKLERNQLIVYYRNYLHGMWTPQLIDGVSSKIDINSGSRAYRWNMRYEGEQFKKGIKPKRDAKYGCGSGCTSMKEAIDTLGQGFIVETEYADKQEIECA